MIVTSVVEAGEILGRSDEYPADRPATMRGAILVTPHGFRISAQSASDNHYMQAGSDLDLERAHAQHHDVVTTLLRLGVPVTLFAGRDGLDDGIYPNNVFATATPQRFIVGAMRHAVRRREAERADVRSFFETTLGYEIHDLSRADCVAELSGPLVLDRARGIGFCGVTERVDNAGCSLMHDAFGLRVTWRFVLVPAEYHTNLVLAVLAGRACVVHATSLQDPGAVEVLRSLYGGRILLLNDEEKNHFVGNCLAVTEKDILFSRTATRALRSESIGQLRSWGFAVHDVEIDELEKGGGSLRCLIAEIF